MKETINILNKVLVWEYYRQNAAFFLLIIALAFGFMSGVEHRALAEFFTRVPNAILIPLGVWLIYFFKVILFNTTAFRLPANQFVHHLTLFDQLAQLGGLLITLVPQMAPVILYAAFLMATALQHRQWFVVAQILFFLVIILAIGTGVLYFNLRSIVREKKITFLKKLIDVNFTKPLLQFYMEWLIRKEFFLLISSKIFTCLLLFGVSQLYKYDNYDWRLMALGILLSFVSNIMIILKIHEFENVHFPILRSLPVTIIKRLTTYSLVFICVSLPETIILIRNFPTILGFNEALLLILFGLSIGVLNYGRIYSFRSYSSTLSNWIIVQIIFGSILILFSTPLWILIILNLSAGSFLLKRSFYNFESDLYSGEKYSHNSAE